MGSDPTAGAYRRNLRQCLTCTQIRCHVIINVAQGGIVAWQKFGKDWRKNMQQGHKRHAQHNVDTGTGWELDSLRVTWHETNGAKHHVTGTGNHVGKVCNTPDKDNMSLVG